MTKITFADEEHPRPSTKPRTYKRKSQRGGSRKPVDSPSQTPDFAATTVSSMSEPVPIWESLSFTKKCWEGTCEHDAETIVDMPADDFLNHLGSGASIARLEEFGTSIRNRSGMTRAQKLKLMIICHLREFKTHADLQHSMWLPNHSSAIALLRCEEVDADEETRATYSYNRTVPITNAIFGNSVKGTETKTVQDEVTSWEYLLEKVEEWQMV